MKVKTKINHFNDNLAIHIFKNFGTMICFYIFVIYGLSPIFFPEYMEKILYWSNFIQLISLPVLAVGQNILSKGSERRAQKTYDMVKEELEITKKIIRNGSVLQK
jgi:hypothetical protein